MNILSTIWSSLSNSRILTVALMKLGNQCAAIVSRRLANSSNPETNGEDRLIQYLAPQLYFVVDVGANIGEWTDLVLKYASAPEVVCFEPSPECLAVLQVKYGQQVTLSAKALSDFIGRETFAAEKHCGKSSALASGYHNDLETEQHEVNVCTLDEEFLSSDRMIDLLKIDTEGFDLHVLRGARGLLDKKAIRCLQFEYTSKFWRWQNSTLESAFRLLEQHGYTTYLLNSHGLHRFDIEKWSQWICYGNFISCPTESVDQMAGLLSKKRL